VSAPASGATVVLELNDRARVALGDRIGPSAVRIAGVVQAPSDTAYFIRVSSVEYLNGQSNKWAGEPFTVPASFVSRASRREFSRSRTVSLGAAITAALIGTVLGVELSGSGSSPVGGEPRPGTGGP
jgi:hypothetical protein